MLFVNTASKTLASVQIYMGEKKIHKNINMPKFVTLKKCLDLFIPSIYRLRVAFSLDTLE